MSQAASELLYSHDMTHVLLSCTIAHSWQAIVVCSCVRTQTSDQHRAQHADALSEVHVLACADGVPHLERHGARSEDQVSGGPPAG